ncbi:MAG: alpha/beta hydrolase [Myxococcota bacterium]
MGGFCRAHPLDDHQPCALEGGSRGGARRANLLDLNGRIAGAHRELEAHPGEEFRRRLIDAARALPTVTDPLYEHEDQKHLTLFVHGYNNSWDAAARRYDGICRELYDGPDGLGICVLFAWPSDGLVTNYLADRADADRCAQDVADLLAELFEYPTSIQRITASDPTRACPVKTSIIAHSMGNYVLQRGMARAWTRVNQPLPVSLFSQLFMIAADVDNDLFASGEDVDGSDGDAMSNFCYRISALYSGRDPALAASAGLKHFGKRRLGRSGLDQSAPCPDNVWDTDCTPFFAGISTPNVHSAYFEVRRRWRRFRPSCEGASGTYSNRRDSFPREAEPTLSDRLEGPDAGARGSCAPLDPAVSASFRRGEVRPVARR